MAKSKIVIVGGGFGGLNGARQLSKNRDLEILLLDRRNHHLFQPLLYQVAMAGLSPADIAFPIRSIFRRRKNVRVLMAEVLKVDTAALKVQTTVGDFDYDYLILACGSEHSYFGHDAWEENAPGLKTVEQATEIRRRVLSAFEKAEAQADVEKMRQWLTFIVIGGGPTGVELAGTLGEITRYTLARDFRHIDPSHARVILVEAGPKILSPFSQELQQRAKRDLERLGVQIWTNSRVKDVTSEGVQIGEDHLQAKTVIWAAGVKPSSLNAQLGVPLDSQGRVKVGADLSLPGFKNIFVIGDQAHVEGKDGKPLPGLAPVAIQEGRFVARLIHQEIKKPGGERPAFRYADKGQMATIGRKSAVAEVGKLHFTGWFAWWMWLVIHIYYLIGFKNRFFVFIQWAYSYLTYRRGARLITRPNWRSEKPKA
jgi:NADH dehydrogenase